MADCIALKGMVGVEKAKTKARDRPNIPHLRWLVESRADNQRSAVALFKLFQDNSAKLTKRNLAAKANGLVAVCFSLWRAAFLADKTGMRVEVFRDANAFLEKMITDNAIGYPQDRLSKEWTFNYYMDNATAAIRRLGQHWAGLERHLSRKKGEKVKGKTGSQRRWDRCQKALNIAINHLKEELQQTKG